MSLEVGSQMQGVEGRQKCLWGPACISGREGGHEGGWAAVQTSLGHEPLGASGLDRAVKPLAPKEWTHTHTAPAPSGARHHRRPTSRSCLLGTCLLVPTSP